MNGKNIKNIFDDKKINKIIFTEIKNHLRQTIYIDISKILVSKRELYGKKIHLIILLDMMIMMILDHYRPLCIQLPEMIEYPKYFENNQTISFKVSDKNC